MRQYTNNKKAFTLIELLIAIFIFAIISVIALSAFMTSMNSKDKVVKAIDNITNIQSAYVVIKRDISQIVNRSILSEDGESIAAVTSGFDHKFVQKHFGDNVLEFTRMGNIPLEKNQKVSNLVRIAYYTDGKRLSRVSFRELDQTDGSLVDAKEILSDIDSFSVKFVDVFGSEVSNWFMESSAQNNSYKNLPYGIILRFRTKTQGDIEWIFTLPVLNNKT